MIERLYVVERAGVSVSCGPSLDQALLVMDQADTDATLRVFVPEEPRRRPPELPNDSLKEPMKLKRVTETTRTGTTVLLVEDDGSLTLTATRSDPWKLGSGDLVVKVHGKTGGYSAERIFVARYFIPKEQIWHLAPELPNDSRRVLVVSRHTVLGKEQPERTLDVARCLHGVWHAACPGVFMQEVLAWQELPQTPESLRP